MNKVSAKKKKETRDRNPRSATELCQEMSVYFKYIFNLSQQNQPNKEG